MLTDEEIRHMAVSLMKAKTARDKQRRIGASNLSNGCDFCLASNFQGDMRETPITDRAFLGRVLGIAGHGVFEQRIRDGFLEQHPDAVAEEHVWFADLRGYGRIGGTIDLWLRELLQIVDWKGSTRKKLLLLIDYLTMQAGGEAIYGRTHKEVKLSEKQYAEEMSKMEFKVTGYYGQQTLYMHGSGARRANLVFFNRDGTGWFDNPEASDYDNPKRVHDVWTFGFDYNEDYALALIQRGQDIYDHLESGGEAADFERHPLCFPCSLDQREKAEPAPLKVAA